MKYYKMEEKIKQILREKYTILDGNGNEIEPTILNQDEILTPRKEDSNSIVAQYITHINGGIQYGAIVRLIDIKDELLK